jgi:hypothetical protein
VRTILSGVKKKRKMGNKVNLDGNIANLPIRTAIERLIRAKARVQHSQEWFAYSVSLLVALDC